MKIEKKWKRKRYTVKCLKFNTKKEVRLIVINKQYNIQHVLSPQAIYSNERSKVEELGLCIFPEMKLK